MPENTPVLVKRFYPTLSSVVNQDEIPDALGFIKEGILFLFDKIHFKDLQYSKSPRGDAAFYSLSLVTKDRLDIEIPTTGIFLVLNPDITSATPDDYISAFPITIEYEWKLLAYLRSFNLNQFDFSPKAFFETALRVLSISEEQAIANFINTFTEPVDENTTALQQFVDDLNGFNTDANFEDTDENTSLTDIVKDIYAKTNDYATIQAFGTYILNNDVAETKAKLNIYFRSFLPQDIESYIKDILIPKFRATLLLRAAVEFPRSILKPVYPEGHPNALEEIPEDPSDEFPDRVLLSFGEALFFADTEKGFGYNLNIILNTITPAMIGNTGFVIDIHNLKIDLSTEENIIEADLDGRPPEFMGIYTERTDIFLPKKWFKKETGQTLAITGEQLLIGTGGISGTIALRATYAVNAEGDTVTDYFSEYFDLVYPLTVVSNGTPEPIDSYDDSTNSLLSHINALSSPYNLKFEYPLTVEVDTQIITFESEATYNAFVSNIDPGNFMWFQLGQNEDKAWRLGFNRFDLTFHHGQVIESNLKARIEIPKFRNVDNANETAIIDLEGHWYSAEDFSLTASFLPSGQQLTLFNFVTINFLTAEVGKTDDRFYIGTSCEIWFENGIMDKILNGQKIVVPQLRVYDNGSIEIVGGNGFIPLNVSLNLGPVEIAVTGIHFGSHQREHNGMMRKYNYWGFDGAISLDPLGLDARGEGIKYYYTVDNDEHNDSGHDYLHVKTIEVDLVIPGNADPETATAIIHGMLSIPEPGESQEYIGEVSVLLPQARVASGGAAMRLQPQHPAFLIDAGIEIPKPIPFAATGLGFYGFGGLLGYGYVAEKEAIGLVSDDDRWYDYFVYPERGVNIHKFSGPEREHSAPFSVGAGTVLGTLFDEGYTFSTRLMAILSLPSVFILDGRANVLGERVAMLDHSEPPFFAGVAIGEDSLEFWFGADYQLPSNGFIIDLYAEVQAGFFFSNPSAWYLNFGTKQNPITAQFLTILKAQSFLMLSAQGIEAGARVEFDLKKNFFGIKVQINAYVEAGGFISFERPQLGGYIAAGGTIRVTFWKVAGFKLKLDAILAAEAADPFLLYAELRIRICIKLIFKICSPRIKLKLKWGGSGQPNRSPIAPLPDAASHHIDRTEQSVKGVHMLTGEIFDLDFLDVVLNGSELYINPGDITQIIPMDTFIDFKILKGLIPGEVSGLIGGYSNPPTNHIDLIPPKKIVKGGKELRQVKHKYSIENIEINALDKDNNWVAYHPYQAVVKPEDEVGDITHLRIGYWQKSSKQYNAVRLLATTPFSYLAAGEPGWFIPEQMGIGPSDLFCEGTHRELDCMDFLISPSVGSIYYPPTQFTAHNINGVYFNLVGEYFGGEDVNGNGETVEDNFRISNAANSHGYAKSLEFDNFSALAILLPEPSVQVDLKLNTHAQGATITFYKSLLNDVNPNPEYEEIGQLYKSANELQSVVSYENELEFISKIIIAPHTPNSAQIELLQAQIAALWEDAYSNAVGEDTITLTAQQEAQLDAWEAELAALKGETCSLPVLMHYFVNEYQEAVSKDPIRLSDLRKLGANYYASGSYKSKNGSGLEAHIICKLDEQGIILESFETQKDSLSIPGDSIISLEEDWLDYKFIQSAGQLFHLQATKFNNDLDVIWNKNVEYAIEVDDLKDFPSSYIKRLDAKYTVFSYINIKKPALNITLFDVDANVLHYVLVDTIPLDPKSNIVKISPHTNGSGGTLLFETKGVFYLIDFNIKSDKVFLNGIQKLIADNVSDIENVTLNRLLISALIDSRHCIALAAHTEGFSIDFIQVQHANESNFNNLKFVSGSYKNNGVFVRNRQYVFRVALSETSAFTIIGSWQLSSLRNLIQNLRFDTNENHFVVSCLIDDVQDPFGTYTGVVKEDFNTCVFVPFNADNSFDSITFTHSKLNSEFKIDEHPEKEALKIKDTLLMTQEEICPVTSDGEAPEQCFTSLQQICWMSLENYEFNITIPGQEAIAEDQQAMEEAIEKIVQPVWRPNTKYYVKFSLKDEVDNGEGDNDGTFDYYYGFKTVGPVGHFQHHPEVDYLPEDENPDQYPITSLRQYIDYNRSYPNADGSLLRAKPLFYGANQCKISLFFDKQWAYHMLSSWTDYQNTGELTAALHIAIKDPISEVVIPYPLDGFTDETVPASDGESWESDTDPSIPAGILLLNNLINHINANNSHINCELTIGDPISPAAYFYEIILTNLKPQKLYTALFYNAFEVNSDDILENREIHQYVFQTSRYENFVQQVNSYVLRDDADNERSAVFQLPITATPEEVTTAYNIVVGNNDAASDALESQYQDYFDRVTEGVLGLTPIDPPATTEFNVVRNETTGQVIGVLIRNPEPYNNPKIPLEYITDTIVVVFNTSKGVNNAYKILHSKDYSQALIMHSSGQIKASKISIRFIYKTWDGNAREYVIADSNTDRVRVQELQIQ